MALNSSAPRDAREPTPANTPRAPRPARGSGGEGPAAPRSQNQPRDPARDPARGIASASPDGELHLRDAAARRAADGTSPPGPGNGLGDDGTPDGATPRRARRAAATPDTGTTGTTGTTGPPRPRWQWRSGLNWLNDRRFQLFIGFTLIMAALYLAGAFVSYLFTGHADQSVVESAPELRNQVRYSLIDNAGRIVRETTASAADPRPIALDPDHLPTGQYYLRVARVASSESENWLGELGSRVSQAFLFDWFGLASFVLLPVIFFLGYRIVFRRAPVSLPWMMGLCFFLTGWISVALGYVVVARAPTAAPLPEWLSGAMGYEVAAALRSFLGAGTVLLLGLLGVGFVVGFFNVTTLNWAAAGWLDARQRRADAREAAELDVARRQNARPAGRRAAASLSGAEGQGVEASAAGTYEQQPLGVNHGLNPTAAMVEEEEEEEFDEAFDDDEIDAETGEVLTAGAGVGAGLTDPGGLTSAAATGADADETTLPAPALRASRQTAGSGQPAAAAASGAAAPAARPTGPTFAIENAMIEAAPAGLAAVGAAGAAAVGTGIPLTLTAPVAPPVIAPLDTTIAGLTDDLDDDAPAPGGLSTYYDPTLDLPRYLKPGTDLLKDYGPSKVQVSKEELEAKKDRIVETLGHYNIGIASIKATIGPTVTLYEIIPDAGVRISKIKNLEDDIALSLAALGIRIIAPIPGKGTIGIEVPNSHKEMVSMRSMLESDKFRNAEMDLPIAFGRTITNEPFVVDLARMPHLLMAGATGQGKSVGLNVILTSLLYKRHPAELKFVLVDPKKVELSLFNKIERHFLATLPGTEEAIITDTSKVVDTLNSLCILMDQRYSLLKDAGCRNLKEYNKKFIERRLLPTKGHKFMPFIVVVIDELADLMMTAGKEVEQPIARLAQLARAIGIHLVVATQRPSVNVITGIIKANFPARISFKVTAKVDSRTILDASGADQLIGQGDMLFSVGSDLVRVQCAFVDTPEVDELCDFIGAQQGYPTAYELPEYVGDKAAGNDGSADDDSGERDALFAEAAKVIVTHQQGSTSLLQRRLKLGYNRAGRLIDQLEKAGVVGPFEGSKSRDVLIPDEYALEQLLNRLENGGEKAPF